MHFSSYTLWQKSISALLLCLFILGSFLPTQRLHAITVTEVGAQLGASLGTKVQTTATAVASSLSAAALKALSIKAWTLDGIAWGIAKIILNQMLRATTQWVATGFKGSPMYVTDLEGFLLNAADETAGEIIWGSNLDFLCSPINVRLALNIYYQGLRSRNPLRCTLTGAMGNIQGFIDGNFAQGGWPAWFSISLNPVNGTFGAGLAAQGQLIGTIRTKEGVERVKRDWARGFLETKKCVQIPGPPNPTTGKPPEHCETTSPGSIISDALKGATVDASIGTLVEVDSINELVGALIQQGLFQSISAAQGIFGSSRSGSGNSGYGSGASYTAYASNPATSFCTNLSYIDQLSTPACNPSLSTYANSGDTVGVPGGSGSFFEAINDERAYQAIQRRIIVAAEGVIDEARLRGEWCSVNDAIITEATEIYNAASSSVLTSERNLQNLIELQNRYETGSDTDKLAAASTLSTLIGTQTLHNSITNVQGLDTAENIIKKLEGAKDPYLNPDPLKARIQDCPNSGAPDVLVDANTTNN